MGFSTTLNRSTMVLEKVIDGKWPNDNFTDDRQTDDTILGEKSSLPTKTKFQNLAKQNVIVSPVPFGMKGGFHNQTSDNDMPPAGAVCNKMVLENFMDGKNVWYNAWHNHAN